MEEQSENFYSKKNEHPISYEAHKIVEEELINIEKQAKKEIQARQFKNEFSKISEKIYCEPCRFRNGQQCTNQKVLISFGKFSSSPLKYGTYKHIPIHEANNDNNCKFFLKGKYPSFLRRIMQFTILSLGTISIIAALSLLAIIGIIIYLM